MAGSTEELLIEKGLSIMRMNGYRSTGISRVLKEARVPKGSFYHYFGSKEEFGLKVIAYLRNRLSQTFRGYLCNEGEPGESPLDRLRSFFESFRRDISDTEAKTGCGFGNISQEMAAIDTSFREKLAEVYSELTDYIKSSLEAAVEIGEIGSDSEPQELARFIFNSWEGALIFVKVLDDTTPLLFFERYIFDVLLPCLST